ncbi:unnamed protein product [Closterium sp. Yama58-4]|nr:unnamed protein product [Closterium sp. Yama58-4]
MLLMFPPSSNPTSRHSHLPPLPSSPSPPLPCPTLPLSPFPPLPLSLARLLALSPSSPSAVPPPLPLPISPTPPPPLCPTPQPRQGSRSRLSVGGALPLCDYFDLARIATHWISPELFLLLARAALTAPFAAAAARGASPSVAFVHVQTHRIPSHDIPFHSYSSSFANCFIPYQLITLYPILTRDITSQPITWHHSPSHHHKVTMPPLVSSIPFLPIVPHQSTHALSAITSSFLLFTTLLTPHPSRFHAAFAVRTRHTDVLVWVKTTFERMGFQPPTDSISFQMLPYSQEWHAMAQRAMARLPPRYIAVHYRSEFIAFHLAHKLVRKGFKVEAGVLEELMTGCMEAARDLINGMKRRHNISAVFIAADVPFDDKAGSLVRSDSWKETTWRFQGQERVLAAPQEKLRWLREQVAGTVMVDELMPAINHYDPGIVAILDKLLCAHAHVFLAGSITCGGGRGFEEDINIHRHHFNRTPPHRWVSETDKRLFHLNSSSAGAG